MSGEAPETPALPASTHSMSTSHTSQESEKSSIISVKNSCRICLSTTIDPAALATCGHKFCEKCLDKYWRLRDKPNFIVCPLCRNNAYNIEFSKKASVASTKDLRAKFNAMQEADDSSEIMNPSVLCFEIGLIISALYLVGKWLKAPLHSLIKSMLEYFSAL